MKKNKFMCEYIEVVNTQNSRITMLLEGLEQSSDVEMIEKVNDLYEEVDIQYENYMVELNSFKKVMGWK